MTYFVPVFKVCTMHFDFFFKVYMVYFTLFVQTLHDVFIYFD